MGAAYYNGVPMFRRSRFQNRPAVGKSPEPSISTSADYEAHGHPWSWRKLDLTTPIGRGILAFLSSLAEDERARILARANGGRAAAKKRGVKFGPKPKLAAHQAREAARMVREDGKSLREVAHHYHVGHSTIVRALERAEA